MPGHFLNELRTTFADHAGRPALAFEDATLSFGALEALAKRCAGWMQGLGVAQGDRVVIAATDKRSFLAAHVGALFAGAVVLPLNPKFTRDELRHFLGDSGARLVVAGDGVRATIEAFRADLPELRAIVSEAEAWDPPETPYREPTVGADEPCLMLYSSGTTGRPKGVVHTHANLASSLHALRECWRFTPEDVLVNVLPLFHIHGLSFATNLSLLTGSCMRVDESFHPKRMLDSIGRGTVFMAVPTFYYAFLERPEFRTAARGWGHVRLFTCGSAPIRPEVLPELESILGRPVINRYGMTEAHVIASLPLDGPWPQGSVGLPLSGVTVRIAGEGDTEAPAGSVGAVLLRGPNLFRQYWRLPEATRAAFATGWFDTGDLGSIDPAGFLTLAGRKNDLIITNGFNVYPQVVERVINECPGVKESAVLGLPDDRRGERVAAAVVRGDSRLDERALRAYCAEHLIDYQRPSVVVFVDDLPRNALGKVLRRELRDRFGT